VTSTFESLREKCRKKQRTGVISSLVAQIARLEGVRKTLQERFTPTGTKRFTWRTIETAFKNRILTGAVINANFIKPRKFLEEIKNTILERIHSVMAEHGSIKINTAFNGEFVAGEKTTIKTIAMKNYELFPTSDLHEWYPKYVIDTILASLEEFQERDNRCALSHILDINYHQRQQVQSSTRGMPHRFTMENYAQEGGGQCQIQRLCMFRMGSGRCLTSCDKAFGKNE